MHDIIRFSYKMSVLCPISLEVRVHCSDVRVPTNGVFDFDGLDKKKRIPTIAWVANNIDITLYGQSRAVTITNESMKSTNQPTNHVLPSPPSRTPST